MEQPARYLAARIRAEHPLSTPAATEELLAVCEQRGVIVIRSAEIHGSGYYSVHDQAIVLHWDAPAWVLAHELYHHLVADNEEHEIIYTFPDFGDGDDEEQAELFAWLLCGEER